MIKEKEEIREEMRKAIAAALPPARVRHGFSQLPEVVRYRQTQSVMSGLMNRGPNAIGGMDESMSRLLDITAPRDVQRVPSDEGITASTEADPRPVSSGSPPTAAGQLPGSIV